MLILLGPLVGEECWKADQDIVMIPFADIVIAIHDNLLIPCTPFADTFELLLPAPKLIT
jgi:hypothetical protein